MLIGVMGFIGSGKGTISDYLITEHHFIGDSFASSLKDACSEIFDWPREMLEGDTQESRIWRDIPDQWWSNELAIPNFSPRYALQYIGTDVLRKNFHPDVWLLTVKNRIMKKGPTQNVVISDVRFSNEVQMIKDLGGLMIWVKRGPLPVWYNIALNANRGDEDAQRDMAVSFPEVHLSEWAWIGTQFDYEIYNDSSIESLRATIDKVILN